MQHSANPGEKTSDITAARPNPVNADVARSAVAVADAAGAELSHLDSSGGAPAPAETTAGVDHGVSSVIASMAAMSDTGDMTAMSDSAMRDTAMRDTGATDGGGAGGRDADPDGTGREPGYRGVTATNAAGITYRQLDYWARTGLVVPSVRDASGSGTQRLYSFRDIVVLKVVKRLLDAGVSLQNIRKAIETLRRWGEDDLATMTLISDGTTVYECRSAEEVVDLLQGGQGVFGIAISGAFKEIQGSLADLPLAESAVSPATSGSESTDHGDAGDVTVDELAARRARRRAG